MNSDQLVTASSISSKIYTFFVFVTLEIVCNSLTFFYDINGDELLEEGSLNNPNMGAQKTIGFALIG